MAMNHVMPNSSRIFRYFNFLFVLLLVGHHSFGQSLEDSLINSLRTHIRIEQEQRRGIVSWEDETKECLYLLISSSSINELKKYVSDPNPAIRSAIFAALVQKGANQKLLKGILDDHINDTAQYQSGGDLVITWTVRDYMQTGLRMKNEGTLPAVDYQTALEEIRKRPRFLIPGMTHHTITKELLLNLKELVWSTKGAKILSFTVTVDTTVVNVGSLISEEVKSIFRELKPGEWFYIDEIKATSEGRSVKLPSLALKIK
jgi:hypothetical protein